MSDAKQKEISHITKKVFKAHFTRLIYLSHDSVIG